MVKDPSTVAFVCAVVFVGAMAATAHTQHFSNATDAAGATFTHQNPPASMMMGGGMAWFDLDADGDDDLFLSSSGGKHRLLRNDGGVFTDIIATSGIETIAQHVMGVSAADYDDDGFVDLFLTCRGPNVLLRNVGDETFEDVTAAFGLADPGWGTTASWADFDADDDLDLYVGNYIEQPTFPYHTGQTNRLYINEGTSAAPVFVDRAAELGVDIASIFVHSVDGFPNPKLGEPTAGCTLSTCTLDFDDDGDPDLAVGNDFGIFVVPNKLFRNDTQPGGPLVFTDVSESTGFGHSQYNMGINPSDYDRDGDWDFYLSDLGPNLLLRNDGGVYTDVTEEAGPIDGHTPSGNLKITSWSTAWADVDNDGWEDLYVVNGYIPAATFLLNKIDATNSLWLNESDGTFSYVTASGTDNSGFGRGGGAADYDGDGLLDLFALNNGDTVAIGADQSSRLFRNEGTLAEPGAGWLQVRLRAALGHGEALGARVDAFVNGELMRRQVLGDAVYVSSKSRMLHFGLADAGSVDTLLVRWPSGTSQQLHDVDANQRLLLDEPLVTIKQVVAPVHTHAGLEWSARVTNGDPDAAHVAKVTVALMRHGRTLVSDFATIAVPAGDDAAASFVVPVPSALASKLAALTDLEVRVDVTTTGSRGLDTRVVSVDL